MKAILILENQEFFYIQRINEVAEPYKDGLLASLKETQEALQELRNMQKELDDLKQEVECHRKRFAEQSAKENRGIMTDDPCRKGSRGMYT